MSYRHRLEGTLSIHPALSAQDKQQFDAEYDRFTWGLVDLCTLYHRDDTMTADPIKDIGILMTDFFSPRNYRLDGVLRWIGEDGSTGRVEVEDKEIRVSADNEPEPQELGISLIESLVSDNPDRQVLAIDLINQDYEVLEDRERFLPHLAALTEDKDMDLRLAAIHTLARFKEYAPKVVPILTMALTDPVPWIRTAAAEILGRFGKSAQDALPALNDLTHDDEQRPKAQAHQAIHRILSELPRMPGRQSG
ncbi:MAG: HEAT repeat domain-containing protein [Acidobacteriota bacterium]|nr:HEAT repeat domain-containing protein [Acidobacteriota bacterium]